MNIIWWLIIGLIAGGLARLVVPGRDPMGFLGTLLLGLVGSVIGGFLGDLFDSGNDDFSPAGLIGSIIGAIVALLIYRWAVGRRGYASRAPKDSDVRSSQLERIRSHSRRVLAELRSGRHNDSPLVVGRP